jgi:hypothetical protein
MRERIDQTVFRAILSPVLPLIEQTASNIEGDKDSYRLSFVPFTVNLLFGIISTIKTRVQLVTEIKTSQTAKALDLVDVSNTSYTEAFHRYPSKLYRHIFLQMLDKLNLLAIPDLDPLGMFMLVDGSIFPAIKLMTWACYKKTANALKLHLALNLNLMVPAEFLSTHANYSERKFLRDIIKGGVTYICDRGYFCLRTFRLICEGGAFFIVRSKSNLKHTVKEFLVVSLPADVQGLMNEVKDMRIVFQNDKNRDKSGNKLEYRMISFTVMGDFYVLVTNRFDLTTYQIIMLYAYRWQVELVFRFLKRTMNCIHLLCHEPEGIEIQFHLYMIGYLLLLSFKQECLMEVENGIQEETVHTEGNQDDEHAQPPKSALPKQGRVYVCGLVSLLGEGLRRYWKLSVHWLITVRNFLSKPLTPDLMKRIVMQI